jgi:hypothetical protein
MHINRLNTLFANLQSQIISQQNTDVKAMTEKLAAKRLRQRAYAREYYKKNKAVVNAKTAARRKAKAGK